MKILLKNPWVVNVFADEISQANILLEEDRILGVGAYSDEDADVVRDLTGRYVCPGFIDGHIHIESTMLTPSEFARACLPHGTTAVVADPHEIANVCGSDGIRYMMEASTGLPLTVYIALPSCVPATPHDESGATLTAADLRPFYEDPRVLALGEVMNYPGVLAGEEDLRQKIADAKRSGRAVNGHAPLLAGDDLIRYIAAGIADDHECTSAGEAKERIRLGQWVMIREGTAARNLKDLTDLFGEPWNRRCLLVADDKHPADLLSDGHIDAIIRRGAEKGLSPLVGIRMATLQAAQRYSLSGVGAVAPGYRADLLVLDDLATVTVRDVYCGGRLTVKNGVCLPFDTPSVSEEIDRRVRHSFSLPPLTLEDFAIAERGLARVIRVLPSHLLTEEWRTEVNGVDTERDIVKIAVIERHHGTGHIGRGYIHGLGLKRGAIASSVSHDSHNLIVVGTNDADMAVAANCVRATEGGSVVVRNGAVLAEMPLPIGGLMTECDAAYAAAQNRAVREAVHSLGVTDGIEPFMNMAFISLAVIPHLKLTTHGLIDVKKQERVSLFIERKE